jgi:hypothetical protein
MIEVDRIEDIRKRARRGQPVAQIARELRVSEPTVRKYRDMEDLSERPRPRHDPQFPALEGFREMIDAWLIASFHDVRGFNERLLRDSLDATASPATRPGTRAASTDTTRAGTGSCTTRGPRTQARRFPHRPAAGLPAKTCPCRASAWP